MEDTREFTEKFFNWLDSNRLRPMDVAEEIRNSARTISTWRSKGIPPSRIITCQSVMDRHASKESAQNTQIFILRPTYDEFREWNRAALEAGQLIEDWAMEGLNTLAEAHEVETGAMRVAETRNEIKGKGGKFGTVNVDMREKGD